MSVLKRFFPNRHPKVAAEPAPVSARAPKPPIELAPVYPPRDPGLPACAVEEIVRTQQVFLDRLKAVVPEATSPGQGHVFEQRYLRPLQSLARHIHLLPASAHDHHAGPGGLFRLCCEIGYYAAQAADGRIFTPAADVESRHALEPLYKYAAFLAGLVCEVYRPLALAIVTDEVGEQWPKFTVPLSDWLAQRGATRYYVSWQAPTRAVIPGAEASSLIGAIWPREEMDRLSAGAPAILRDAFAVSLGQSRAGDSILGDVVSTMREKVLKQDEVTRRSRYGLLRCGHHLEVHLVDALRERIANGAWKIHNGIDGPVWYGTDGLYLAWPECCKAIVADLDSRGLQGLPRNPVTIAESLGLAGFLVSQDSGQWVWSIIVSAPDAEGEPKRRHALRIREAATLLGFLDAKCKERPFAEYLVVRTPPPPPPSAPTQTDGVATASAYQLAETPAPGEPPPPKATKVAGGNTQPVAIESKDADQQSDFAGHGTSMQPVPTATGARGGDGGVPEVSMRPSPPGGSPVAAQHAEPNSRPLQPQKASPADLVNEAVRKALKAAEAEMLGRWIERFKAGRGEAVVALSDGSIAVSQETLDNDDLDLSQVVSQLDKRRWLGAIPGEARGLRAGMIQFADKKKIGFVISSGSAKAIGFEL